MCIAALPLGRPAGLDCMEARVACARRGYCGSTDGAHLWTELALPYIQHCSGLTLSLGEAGYLSPGEIRLLPKTSRPWQGTEVKLSNGTMQHANVNALGKFRIPECLRKFPDKGIAKTRLKPHDCLAGHRNLKCQVPGIGHFPVTYHVQLLFWVPLSMIPRLIMLLVACWLQLQHEVRATWANYNDQTPAGWSP